MKSYRERLMAVICLLALLPTGSYAVVQDSRLAMKNRLPIDVSLLPAGTFKVFGAKYFGKVVTGAPYSATAITEHVQTLSDGNQIIRRNEAKVYRDSQGRTRLDQKLQTIGKWTAAGEAPQMTYINDPVIGVSYNLNPHTRTVTKSSAFKYAPLEQNRNLNDEKRLRAQEERLKEQEKRLREHETRVREESRAREARDRERTREREVRAREQAIERETRARELETRMKERNREHETRMKERVKEQETRLKERSKAHEARLKEQESRVKAQAREHERRLKEQETRLKERNRQQEMRLKESQKEHEKRIKEHEKRVREHEQRLRQIERQREKQSQSPAKPGKPTSPLQAKVAAVSKEATNSKPAAVSKEATNSKEAKVSKEAATGREATKSAGTKKTETLGKQTIEGVEVEGSRSIRAIPAGEIGNTMAIEIVDESWYSADLQVQVMTRYSDPRSGVTTYRLSNIRRSEPERSLFEIPADYVAVGAKVHTKVEPVLKTETIKKSESIKKSAPVVKKPEPARKLESPVIKQEMYP